MPFPQFSLLLKKLPWYKRCCLYNLGSEREYFVLKGGPELDQEHTGSDSPTGPDSARTVLSQMDQGTKGSTYGEGLTVK